MAFANLFTRLSAVDEVVRSPCESALPCRKLGEEKARKREIWGEQQHYNTRRKRHQKRQSYQAKTTETYNAPTSSKDYDSKAVDYHMEKSENEHVGFTEELHLCSHSSKAGQNSMDHKVQIYKTKNNYNVNKQQQRQKKKNRHWQNDIGGPANRRGCKDGTNKGGKQDVPVKWKRCMTEEFKEQNALVVDGRLLCRHFLQGKCIKGDDCQLEHIQVVNNVIKKVCKFYIQGSCAKGESCPYMHYSFPCKFFHVRGKCFQGAECRFSHEPLTDLTKQLLDEALQRDKDLYESAEKAKQDASGQPENTEESTILEENMTLDNPKPDILMHPIRPNFYNSSCPSEPHAEKETFLCQTEGLADIAEHAVPPHATDATQSHSPPSSNLSHKEPVSYSVEAVLGSKTFKPFPSLFATPASQESTAYSAPQSYLDCPSSSANQSDAPYSVDAVLGSCKAVGNPTCSHSSTPPPAQSISYTPKADPPSSSANQNEKFSYSINTDCESNKSQSQKPAERASHKVKSDLLPPFMLLEKSMSSKTKADMKGGPIIQAPPHHRTKGNGHLPRDMTCLQVSTESQKRIDTVLGSEDCKSKGVLPVGPTKPVQRAFHSLFSSPPSQTSAPKRLSCVPSASQRSIQSPHPSSSKGKVAVPAGPVTSYSKTSVFANCVTHQFAPKQPTEIKQNSQRAPSGLKASTQPHDFTETTTDCHSKMAHCVDSAVGCSKTMKRPFHMLFASPITDSFDQLPRLQATPDSVMTPSFPQDSVQSSHPTPGSADCRSKDIPVKTAVEPGKATARSFLNLFASPISETTAPLPCIQSLPDSPRTSSCPQAPDQSGDPTSCSTDCKRRASTLETPFLGLFSGLVSNNLTGTPPAPRSPDVSPRPKRKKANSSKSAEHINRFPEQLENPACSLMSDPVSEMSTNPIHNDTSLDPSTTQAQQRLPDVSSHKGSSEATTANSILKTLFLCLSPYHQDTEDVPLESENEDKNSTGCVFTERQLKREEEEMREVVESQIKEELKGEMTLKDEPVEMLADPHHQRKETTGGSTSRSPGVSQAQVRASGMDNLTKPTAPLTQPHSRLTLQQSSGQKKCVNGNVGVTPLKDLFKTLDPTASPFGY